MSSDNIEMDQNVAKRLFAEGGTMVILNVPCGTDFGIDYKSWTTGEDFKGIKMIPPGFHFVHYSATDEFGEQAPRVGFFHNFKKSELLVKRWDPKEEGISPDPVPQEIVERIKEDLKNLDRYLGPYPYNVWKQWKDLTNRIDVTLMERCTPLCGYVRSALELEHCTDAARPRGGDSTQRKQRKYRLTIEDKEEQLLPDMKPKPGTELRLSNIPDRHYPEGSSPAEITRHSLDSSYVLDTVLKTMENPLEIIGEIQLTFACFLIGQNLDAFEHWKKLISLLCSADSAIPVRQSIYTELLKVIEIQLSQVPEDLFCDIVTSNNFIYQNLRKLFANIELNSEVEGRLKSKASRLQERLSSKFLWDFSDLHDEAEDEAPVVVSLE